MRRRWTWRRVAPMALVAGIILISAGDRGLATTLIGGIDPLDTLDLDVRPNVIVVLGSSSSMRNTVGENALSGDSPTAKMFTAKAVLQQLVSANESKVSFLFSQYDQTGTSFSHTGPGDYRFRYMTTSTLSPSMTTTDLTVKNPAGGTANRGVQSWMDIRAGWNTLYYGETTATPTTALLIPVDAAHNTFFFNEQIASGGSKYFQCTITIASTDSALNTAPLSGYTTSGTEYSTDAQATALAALLTTKLNHSYSGSDKSCLQQGGGGSQSLDVDLRVTYTAAGSPNQGSFTISRSGGSRQWQVLTTQPSTPNSILTSLGFTAGTNFPTGVPPGGGLFNDSTATYWATTGSVTKNAPTKTTPITSSVCSAPVTAQIYQAGGALAAALQTAMNNPTCSPARLFPNTYTVTYDVATGIFTFTRATGTTNYQMLWSSGTPNNIAGALGEKGASDTPASAGSFASATPYSLLYRDTGFEFTENVGTPPTSLTTYSTSASRLWNGETLSVLSDGTICTWTSGTTTNPASFQLQQVSSCGGLSAVGSPVTFTFVGGLFSGNSATSASAGFQGDVSLVACNSTASQSANINPFLRNAILTNVDGTLVGYTERQDGSWDTLTVPSAGGIPSDGPNPIMQTLVDLKTLFNGLWSTGQATPALSAISTHSDPKERTVVLFLTDGDDNIAGTTGNDLNNNALAAAYRAQLLYAPIVGSVSTTGALATGSDVGSSVTTYMIGYGSGADINRLNWIAWGGSGLVKGTTPDNGVTRWASQPTATERTNCTSCIDAFIAPTEATLATTLQAVIDQGAKTGNFAAQAAVTQAMFEYTAEVAGSSPDNPNTRYAAFVPVKAEAFFSMPGFKGDLQAFSNAGTLGSFLRYSVGTKLLSRVQNGPNGITGMNAITPLRTGALAGQGTFSQLAGSVDANSSGGMGTASSTALNGAIQRRIYTTDQNGYMGVITNDLPNFLNGISPHRQPLWPPTTTGASAVAPADDSTQGLLDAAMGLPLDSSAAPATDFTNLQVTFKACLGSNQPANCLAAAGSTAQMKRARREAREMILANLAGAAFLADGSGNPTRVTSSTEAGEIIYAAKSWVFYESTLATAAVVGQPFSFEPTASGAVEEYKLYRDGPRDTLGKAIDGDSVYHGFGLRNPDLDTTTLALPTSNDSRTQLKPSMTMILQAANDGLHAFRAGPSCGAPVGIGTAVSYTGCPALNAAPGETGGEELWAFVPFDQLGNLASLLQPQTRQNKTYMITTPLRFGDIFVPAPNGSVFGVTLNSGGPPRPLATGLWRRIVVFGRGAGGKYLTALDITNTGPYTGNSLNSQAPIVLWNRGNPDTLDGKTVAAGGTATNGVGGNSDETAYRKMGQTWSVPAMAFVDKSANSTARFPAAGVGTPFVLYVGSGYGAAGEGTAFYTLDSLTGDVVASVDVESVATGTALARAGIAYANAIVASPAAYNAQQLTAGQLSHPAATLTRRVYFADLYGRLWKVLSASPGTVIPMADLGADQPVAGSSMALIGLGSPVQPYIYVSSGNDSRAAGPFKIFGFKDTGTDTDISWSTTRTTAASALETDPNVFTYGGGAYLFSTIFGDDPDTAPLAVPTSIFRGTIEPLTTFACPQALRSDGSCPVALLGRVLFGGTRFNLPGSTFAPAPFPCRSSFDSIIYIVSAEQGLAAYDLNASGSDALRVFTTSRKVGAEILASTSATGGSEVALDEGILGTGTPPPPPPMGAPPQITPSSPQVIAISTIQANAVCQQ